MAGPSASITAHSTQCSGRELYEASTCALHVWRGCYVKTPAVMLSVAGVVKEVGVLLGLEVMMAMEMVNVVMV